MIHQKMNRRSFVKSAIIAGIAANIGTGVTVHNLTKTDKAYAEDEERLFHTCCRACIADCGVIAHVRNGRVIRLEKDPADPRGGTGLCPKGLSGIQALYHPNRNKYPMKLVGQRGSNEWQRISWDEAITTVANKLLDMKAQYGPEALLAAVGGGGHPYFFTPMRLTTAFGGGNGIEPGNAQCYIPRWAAERMINGYVGDTSLADGNCHELYFDDSPINTYVMWGTCPSYHSPATSGRVVAELRKRGVKTVVVDPRFTPDAAKADVWLPVRAGSDAALFMCWINYIIQNKLYDEEFVWKWTNAPLLVNPETKIMLRQSDVVDGGDEDLFMCWDNNTQSVKPLPFPWDDELDPALYGTYIVNGMECPTGLQALTDRVSEYTLEKAAETCWLDADKIEEAIKLYANAPSGLTLGVATDQYPQSSVNAMCCTMLEILMGNIERPGSLLQGFEMGPDSMAKPFWSRYTEEVLKKRFGAADKYHGLLAEQLSHIPSVWNAIMTGEPYSPRIWMEFSGNKYASLADPKRWVDAFSKMDFVCHTYMYPTSFTVESADMILPTVEWLEIHMVKQAINKLIIRQPVTHIFEGINMELICSMIVAKCAELGDADCQEAMTGIDGDRYWYNMEEYEEYQASAANEYTGRNQTWAELCEEGVQEWCSEEDYRHYYVYKEINEETGLPNGFITKSGKCEVYAESFVQCGRTGYPFVTVCEMDPVEEDYDPLPYYMEPDESPNNDTEYPLVMSNGRIPFFHHTTLRNNPFLRELYPAPELWINPKSAEKYDIEQGDWVNVKSRRSTGIGEGGIYAMAKVTDGINPGEVYMERFWNPEYLENGDDSRKSWTTMNVNMLSNFESTCDPVFGSYCLRGYQVQVSKADGAPEGAWVKPTDFEPWMPVVSDQTEVQF